MVDRAKAAEQREAAEQTARAAHELKLKTIQQRFADEQRKRQQMLEQKRQAHMAQLVSMPSLLMTLCRA